MPLNLASPGIVVREVDLTTGRIEPTSSKTGAIVSPFAKGPVEVPILIQNEQDLLQTFGGPYSIDKHYESWFVASSYLSYGGSLYVIRNDDDDLKNAYVGSALTAPKIKSYEDYLTNGYDENTLPGVTFATRNPGSWGNGIKVAIIDSKADQILSGISTTSTTTTTFNEDIGNRNGVIVGSGNTVGINTTGITLGQAVRCDVNGIIATGTTVTGISTLGFITLSSSSTSSADVTTTFDFGTITSTTSSSPIQVGYGVTQAVSGTISGNGITGTIDGHLKGVVTEVGNGSISVKVISHISASGVETSVEYSEGGIYAFASNGNVAIHTAGGALATKSYTTRQDWFNQQTISLTNTTVRWSELADRPSTSAYAESRGARFDEVHVVVFDDSGSITGNAGTILEKHLSLSKAKNAEYSSGSPSYWRKYISENSSYIFAGSAPVGVSPISFAKGGFTLSTDTSWDQDVNGVDFGAAGSLTLTLLGGTNHNNISDLNQTGALSASLSDLSDSYDLVSNTEEYRVDFLLMGSGSYSKEEAQSLATKLISIAELRKDSLAFISPNRSSLLSETTSGQFTVKNSNTITDNLINFFAPLPSSSYAIFDSGYKYMYDRFSGTFRYIPLNGDIAGICARNDANNAPWFSPAGTTRGSILNAVKLAYNPSKTQRDRLYSNRINPVIFSPGAGIILFGDKTALGKASAFDRINVRRLFIYVEDAVSRAAKNVMFEFNDILTRESFVNTIEPFLREILSRRGITDYRIICDQTNNTASVIDANEFIADIYIKPNRAINYIGLSFVATRTGVSFEEVIGNA